MYLKITSTLIRDGGSTYYGYAYTMATF